MFVKLTQAGENFIKKNVEINGITTIKGKNKYPIYGSLTSEDKLWECDLKYNDNKKINFNDISHALIFLFNKYSEQYGLDANIIAAQAFVESRYKLWNYAQTSTASGISQIIMESIYDIIINNFSSTVPKFSQNEINLITNGLIEPNIIDSYKIKSKTTENAKKNRIVLHQNLINYIEIPIKAQCRYMKYIADNCDSLASTTLFCYNRGIGFMSKSYTNSIEKAKNYKSGGGGYYLEGVEYVKRVFSVLGDKDNNVWGDKPKGYSFGYEDKLKLSSGFDPYAANINESSKYNAVNLTDDYMVSEHLSISEVTYSLTAKNNNISNMPNEIQLENIKDLALNVYEKLYTTYGEKLKINSFFRNKKTNESIGGSSSSQHVANNGAAMDIELSTGNSELFYFIKNNLTFDQLIWEFGDNSNPDWVHVSFKRTNNRGEILRAEKVDGKSSYVPFKT